MFKSLIAQHYQAQGILPDGILAQVSDALRLDEAPQEYDIEWQIHDHQLTPVFVCYDQKTASWIQQNRRTLRGYANQFMKVNRIGLKSLNLKDQGNGLIQIL
ncbi:MAG: hypothetical protein HC924_18395 [Synechococcaceae cyanobacterium SM2_3_2]|nr:hypothetical protein [Synechococcaceae cyanobacterium SM2_3_2]